MPVKKDPANPSLDCRLAPAPVAASPTSNRPLRLSAKISMKTAMPKTNAGDWSWKPQPSCSPPARSTRSRPASDQNDASTPAAKTRPCTLTLVLSLPDWLTKPRILMPSTGNTQGMRLSTRPPRKARTMVPPRLPPPAAAPPPPAVVPVEPPPAPGVEAVVAGTGAGAAVTAAANGASIISPPYPTPGFQPVLDVRIPFKPVAVAATSAVITRSST